MEKAHENSVKRNDLRMMYPCFEISKPICTCGEEFPLFTYNAYFFEELNLFAKKFNLSSETLKNLSEENCPKIEDLKNCCKAKCRYGSVFSISIEPDASVHVNKKQITSLPGPLSEGETLFWA